MGGTLHHVRSVSSCECTALNCIGGVDRRWYSLRSLRRDLASIHAFVTTILTHMTTDIDALRSSPLGAELAPSECAVLVKLVHVKTLADGEVLLQEGACDPVVHVVVEGRVQVVKDSVHGRTLLHTLKPGDLIGELSFMDDEPRYGTLLASGPTKVLCLNRADFETLVETEPRVVYKVMRAIMRVAHRVQRNVSRELQDLQNYVYRTGAKL